MLTRNWGCGTFNRGMISVLTLTSKSQHRVLQSTSAGGFWYSCHCQEKLLEMQNMLVTCRLPLCLGNYWNKTVALEVVKLQLQLQLQQQPREEMLKISSFSWETKKNYISIGKNKTLVFFPDKGAQFETMECDTNVSLHDMRLKCCKEMWWLNKSNS